MPAGVDPLGGRCGSQSGSVLIGPEPGEGLHGAQRGVVQRHLVGTGPEHLPRAGRQHEAGGLPEHPAHVVDGAALRADARDQQRAVDGEVGDPDVGRAGRSSRPRRRPTDPSPSTPALRVATLSSTRPATERPSEVIACCTCGPSGLEVSASTNTPASLASAVSRNGSSEPMPEVRRDGDRVDGQRRVPVEVGVGVPLRGAADVAALHVEQHQAAELPAALDHLLEDRDAARAVPLEERRLRLDHARRSPATASTVVIANFSSPLTESVSPQSSSSAGCGSMPTQKRSRSSMALVSRCRTSSADPFGVRVRRAPRRAPRRPGHDGRARPRARR